MELSVSLTRIPTDSALLEQQVFPLLTTNERARYDRLLPPGKKREFLATRQLVRTALSRHAVIAPSEWRFRANTHGRPEIENPIGRPLRFNVSNTRGLVALVVAEGIEVGIDVEDTSLQRETVAIADRFFSPAEVEELHSLPADRQRDRFFDYWTLKESYIKARGMGLAIPLDGFSFRFNPLRIELEPRVGNDAPSWQFWLFNPTAEHRLAVAAQSSSGEPLTMSITWVDPFTR